ncbi:MAG: glycosyltransferase family 4 protein [Taibaiella sp.]|nr:glycosyltransferase family 4 protein [Taibaiella sp.]
MKVAFISRATLFTVPGGDTRQMVQTAKWLEMLGVYADIYRCDAAIPYEEYDLLHFFNITRPADIITHVQRSGKLFVVSPIYIEHTRANEQGKGWLLRTVTNILPVDSIAYLKTIARWLKNGEKIVSPKYLLLGQKKAVQWITDRSACLLPNSESEIKRFRNNYDLTPPYVVVPNGIDPDIDIPVSYDRGNRTTVVCMARYEPIKNQLRLIQALNDTSYQLQLYGKPAANHYKYYEQCKITAASNVTVGGFLESDDLYAAYQHARVHVLPSYFETTGLSSLEAAVMGCNVVVTDKGDVRDYFGDNAWYCDPDDPASIKAAVDAAWQAPCNKEFQNYILQHYTWEKAAKKTLEAYSKVLPNHNSIKTPDAPFT